MNYPVTRIRSAVRAARFDPRAVLAGLVILVLAALGGFALAGVTASRADEVITPVVDLCSRPGAASNELSAAGACGAADDAAQVGPYVVTTTAPSGIGIPGTTGEPGPGSRPGRAGAPGVGEPGAAGEPGPPGEPGRDGADGVDGASPACLSEPGQCRGADGQDGADGVDGAPVASQTYALPDGRILTCARTGGDDLDPMYRCQETGTQATEPEQTS